MYLGNSPKTEIGQFSLSRMSSKNINEVGICRCCLGKGYHRDLKKEYNIIGKRQTYINILQESFNLFLSPHPLLSTQICDTCISRLKDAHTFRQQVVDSEVWLLETLGAVSTEFVNVGLDPLIETKEELTIKNEPEDMHLDNEVCDEEENHIDNLIPGEKELLQRFRHLSKLPTRDNMVDMCPLFYSHLESLKGKLIRAENIGELIKTRTAKLNKKTKHQTKNKHSMVSEKMALATNANNIIENSNVTIFRPKMRSGFPCFYCRAIYDKPMELRDHQKSHSKGDIYNLLMKYTADALVVYADVTDLKCDICEEVIGNFKDLKPHLVNHNKVFYDNYSERVIPFQLYNKEYNFNCHICGLMRETFGALDKHMNSHYKNFVCEQCGAGFITKHRLKVHSYLLHKKNTTIVSCEPCKKVFLNKFKYKIHYENVHIKLKKMRCVKCSEKFIDYYARQRHMEEKHGLEPILYKCTQCECSFNRKYTLKLHVKRRHLVDKDVQCDLCPFMCFSKSELKEHMFKHSGEKNFQCTVCQKSFMRNKTLTSHMRVHNNDKRFSCHLCGEAFVHNWNLKSHLKTHSEEIEDCT